MENYEIIRQLGKGAQGCVYLVRNVEENSQYVMKQIECHDESEANQGFKEAQEVQKLNHPFICKHKEFFVHWEKEISAIYLCIITDFYEKGELSQILCSMRERKEKVDEQVIKRWMGQIFEALRFMHRKSIIHRDLKPSNVYINEDETLSIGDFGLATVMADIRTKARSTVGSMNWMAPEVLENPYDERSDIWSVGCLALEMTSCSLLSTEEMVGRLLEIKHNSQALLDIITQIKQCYTPALADTIQTMLEWNPQQRVTTRELWQIPFVQDCVSYSTSILVEKKKRQQEGSQKKPLPKDCGISDVIRYVRQNLGIEASVKEAFGCLAELSTDENAYLDKEGKIVIIRAMSDYITEEDVQVWGCSILNNTIISAHVDDVNFTREVVRVILQAMKYHDDSTEVQRISAVLLTAMSADDGTAQIMGDAGGIQDILTALRNFSKDASVCTACCSALWSLTINDDNVRIATDQGGIYDVISALEAHRDHPPLIEAACAALIALSMEDGNLHAINKKNCVSLLLESIQQHMSEAKLVKNACLALAAIIEPDEENAYKMIENNGKGEGAPRISAIIRAYEQHKENAEVVGSICSLVMELVEYEEIRAEIQYQQIDDVILNQVKKRYKDNMGIMKPCEDALAKLGGKINILRGTHKV